jgi:hypothetical protein
MEDPSFLPGSFYLGLATAIAAITAGAVALGLLRPERPISRMASLAVVLASMLGIASTFIVVATEQPTGFLHVVIAAGLLLPGAYVLIRALDSILRGHGPGGADLDGIRASGSLPAAEPAATPRRHVEKVLLATGGCAVAVAALLAISTPGLLDVILRPEDRTPDPVGGYAPSYRPVFSCLQGGSDCPGPGYASFNSYRNTPYYGDERAFIDAMLARDARYGGYRDVLEVKRGDVVLIRGYVDNNGDARFETQPGSSTARGVRMRMFLPTSERDLHAVAGQISADNSIPETVSDTATLWAREDFTIRYIRGSARFFNAVHPRGIPLPDELVSDGTHPARGATLGFRKLDGSIAGSFSQQATITIEVQIL